MIYCQLKGGLGNMLFQIAATKSFAIDKNTNCSFPNFSHHLNYLNKDIKYNPSLDHAQEYKSFLKLNQKTPTNKIKIYKYPFKYTPFVPKEDEFVVDGFFQSEKYFSHNREGILEFIKPTEEIASIIQEKYPQVLKNHSVSLHIRRGDYVNLASHHPTQDYNYYTSALKMFDKIDLLVIFSDDIEWCKENLSFEQPTKFIENEKDYIELLLMSKCKGNIIANSSFSWWGAWLNEDKEKIVIAPKKWFGPDLSHINTSDLYSKDWKVI